MQSSAQIATVQIPTLSCFTGQMHLLLPNQQYQSTEVIVTLTWHGETGKAKPTGESRAPHHSRETPEDHPEQMKSTDLPNLHSYHCLIFRIQH